MNMLVVLQESMLVLSLLELEELWSQTINTCLHTDLHIFNLMSCSYQISHCCFQFFDIVCLFNAHWSKTISLISLPSEQCFQVLSEVIGWLKSVENVMFWNEIHITSINNILYIKWLLGFWQVLLSFCEHLVQFIEVFLNQFRIFETNFSKLLRRISHEEVIEVLLIFKSKLNMIWKQMHSPGIIELSVAIIVINSWFVASCSKRKLQLLQCIADPCWIKTSVWGLVIMKQNVLQRLLAQHKCTLHFADGLLKSPFISFVSSLELFHFGNEDFISLLLDKLVFLHFIGDFSGESSSSLCVLLDIEISHVDAILNILRLLLQIVKARGRSWASWWRRKGSYWNLLKRKSLNSPYWSSHARI